MIMNKYLIKKFTTQTKLLESLYRIIMRDVSYYCLTSLWVKFKNKMIDKWGSNVYAIVRLSKNISTLCFFINWKIMRQVTQPNKLTTDAFDTKNCRISKIFYVEIHLPTKYFTSVITI